MYDKTMEMPVELVGLTVENRRVAAALLAEGMSAEAKEVTNWVRNAFSRLDWTSDAETIAAEVKQHLSLFLLLTDEARMRYKRGDCPADAKA